MVKYWTTYEKRSSGWLKNIWVADAIMPFRELRRLIDAEPVGVVVVLDLRDLVLADRDAIRYCSRSRTS